MMDLRNFHDSSANNSSCGDFKREAYYAIITIGETSLALLAYTLILAKVIYEVGKNLGKQGYITILIFYFCEMITLGFYIYYFASNKEEIR